MAIYNTTKVQFEILTKKLNRVFKKLDAINAKYIFTVIREYADDVPVYNVDPITKTQYKVGEMKVECVEFELDFPAYRVGDYRVGCVLERTEDGNMIYTVDDTIDFSSYYRQPLRCDHCGTRHERVKAVVLVNDNGDHKMVGKGCLKDFVGISVDSFANYLYGIGEILNDCELKIYSNEIHLYKEVIDTLYFLAICIEITEFKGYYTGLAYDAGDLLRKGHNPEQKFIDKAKEITAFFETYDAEGDPFETNTRLLVTGKRTFATPNGIVAYAPTLYKKIQERLERERQRKLIAETSKYIGTVGEKITVTVKFEITGGYETQYGYVRIYKFTTRDGNVLIWKTSAWIDEDSANEITITGTVSDHSEYAGVRQTVLKRVKVA